MNAFNRLMRAVETAISKGRSAPATRKAAPKPSSASVRKPIAAHKPTQAVATVGTRVAVEPQLIFAPPVNFRAEKSKPEIIREREPEKRANSIQPRVVSKRAGHTRLREPYNPTPDPVDQVKLAELQAVIAPPPVPPFDWSVTAVPLISAKPGYVARGSCKAVCAKTGRQCRRLAHPEAPDNHAHERGAFFLVLQPGQVPTLRRALDEAATTARNHEVYNGASHVAGEKLPTGGKRDSSAGGLTKAIARARKSAHAGDDTTTGLTSIDAGVSP